MPVLDDAKCGSCKFWQPRYFQIGACARQSRMHSKMFITDEKAELLTHSTFHCSEYEPVPQPANEAL
jgi:hypothetical protein